MFWNKVMTCPDHCLMLRLVNRDTICIAMAYRCISNGRKVMTKFFGKDRTSFC